MRRIFLACAALTAAALTAAAPASAEATSNEYLRLIDKGVDEALYKLDGIADGYGWVNAMLKGQGQRAFFCQPATLALTKEQVTSILRRYVEERPEAGELDAALALMLALQRTFPCE